VRIKQGGGSPGNNGSSRWLPTSDGATSCGCGSAWRPVGRPEKMADWSCPADGRRGPLVEESIAVAADAVEAILRDGRRGDGAVNRRA